MRIALSLTIAILMASPAHAATIYWGGVAGNWSSGSSWIGGSSPGSSDTASFQGYASTSPTSILYTPSTYMSQSSSLMRDGDTATYWWSGGNQASGQCVIIDLGSAKTIAGIKIDAGSTYPGDYGRGYDIYVSSTNNNSCGHASWNSSIASKSGSAVTSIAFTPVTYRYVKIQLNTTASPTAWWAIGEVTVWATGGSSVTATISSTTTVAAVDMTTAVTVAQAAGQDLTVTGNMTVGSGTTYTGSSGDLTIGGDLTVSGGTFTGSSGEVRVTDDLIYSSGTFTAPSSLLQVGGAFTGTSSFAHNSGRVLLTSTGSETFATGGATFNNLFLNDGLVGYWKLDDGATPAVDSSGYGHSATLYNTPTWAAGPTNLQFTNANAMVLTNASSEYGRISRTTALEPTKVSISAWIKRNATQVQYAKIVSKTYNNDGTNPYGTYLLQLNYDGGASKYGQVVFHTGHTGPAQNVMLSTADNAAASGTWTHIVGTYDPSGGAPQKKLYINGVLDKSATVSTALLYDTSSNGDLYIGSGGGGTYFDGTIDDVRIFNRAITAADVAALYAGANRVTPVGTQTLSGAITTAGDLVIASGTLDVSSTGCSSAPCGISVGTSWYNYGATFTPRTGTVTLSGTGTGKVVVSDRSAFYNLTVGSTGTWTLQDRMYVTNALAMSTASTLATGSYPLHAGTLTKSAGTISGASAVVLDSASAQNLTVNSIATPLRIESPLDSGLVGYWKFDEGRGSTAYDDSGNGYNGTVSGNAIWSSDVPSGIPIDDAGSLTLDGSSQYTRVTRTAALEPASVTVAAWVKRVGSQALHAKVVNKTYNNSGTAPYQSYALQMSNDADSSKIRFEVGFSGGTTNGLGSATGALPDGTWTHVVGVYDPSGSAPQQRLYINGALQASDTRTTALYYDTSSNGDIYIGQHGGGSQYFDGGIDDVRIYNRGLSANEVAALYAYGYTTGSSATYTLAANATMTSTLKIDSGSLAASTFSNAITSGTTINGGTYSIGSNTSGQTFTGGLTVNRYGVVSLLSSGGKAILGSGSTFAMDGTLNASSAGAFIQSASGTYYFKVGSVNGATPTLNISGLGVKNTTADGMYINANTGATTTFTQFDNIAFTNGAGTGVGSNNYNLQIYASSLYLTSNGCSFDGNAAQTVEKNVKLIGNGISGANSETRVIFGGATCSTTSSNDCESYDADDDSGADGTGDAGTASVVQWVKMAGTDTTGTIEGFPTMSFRWDTFAPWATYVAYHDTSGTIDTVYVRAAAGTAGYSWSTSSMETIIGTPRWDNVGATHYVYVATTGGKVYQLVDNGSTLVLGSASPWNTGANNPFDCTCTITTPLAQTSAYLYWGASGSKLYTLSKTTPAPNRMPSGSPMTTPATTSNTAPAIWVSTNTFAFLGLSGMVSKMDTSNQTTIANNTNPVGYSVNGRITIVANKLYATDDNGNLWCLDPGTNFAGTTKNWSYKDTITSNHSACTGSVCQVKNHYFDPTAGNVYFGDQDGHIYVIDSVGAKKTGYPYQPGGGTAEVFEAAPFHKTGTIVAGTTTGTLYIIDQTSATMPAGTLPGLIRRYQFGSSTKISSIAYDPGLSVYMVSTANDTNKDGKLYYIDRVTDQSSSYP